MKNLDSTIELNNGIEMPIFGLGLYRAQSGETTHNAIKWAYETGYRLFDTAQIYGNEADVGVGLKNLRINRDEVFVTTKLWNANHGSNLESSFEQSLKNLQLDFVDLFLMHWPVKDHRLESWDKMTELMDTGKTRAIGVSNFMPNHIEELLDNTSIIPAVNQVEFSPYLFDKDLLEVCNKHNIIVQSYSPLTKGKMLNDEKLIKIASNYNKTPAQLLIRWTLEHELLVIPKSTNQSRIEENASVFDFEISSEDMDKMDNWNIDLTTGWNPRTQE